MKKLLKWTAGILGGLLVIFILLNVWAAKFGSARPTAEARAALVSSAEVEVTNGDWIVFRPTGSAPPTLGMILIPGAFCDPQGYAPVLRRIAAAGFLVVTVRQPLNMAVLNATFDSDWPIEVERKFPEIRRWVIAGHSMGASMAGQFVHDYPTAVSGLILWDGFPPPGTGDLSNVPMPTWHIHRATPEGQPPESFSAQRRLFPANSRWIPIPGGIHMYFGSFDGGIYREQWQPKISRDSQHDQVVAATVGALREIAGS